MTLDGFFGRTYDPRLYNCAHLSIDIWECLKRRPVVAAIRAFLLPGDAGNGLGHAEGLRFINVPEDPCFVLMRSKVQPPHVGVFHEGRIIHFASNRRVQYQPPEIATWGYTRVRYCTC